MSTEHADDRADTGRVREVATRARTASHDLALATRATKDAALHAMADALLAQATGGPGRQRRGRRARRGGGHARATSSTACASPTTGSTAMAAGLREVAGLADPVGEVVRGSTLANGLELRQLRVPFGVVGMIYEARPNVTADAAGICLKSGNAVLLRGSSSARSSNAAIVDVLRDALVSAGLPADAVQLVPGDTHDSVKALMRARGLVDVLIPRGGAGLIRSVVEESTVPVIETGSATATSTSTRRPTSTRRSPSSSTPRPTAPACATRPSRCSCTTTSPTTSCRR